MLDACTIQPVTSVATNTTTAVVTPTYGAAVYTGKCKVQNQRAFPSTPDAGEHQFTVTPNELHLPVTAVVATGQLVSITASVDPVNVGRKFRIRSTDRKSLQTALRCQVEEVVH
jgi:hypothetical protein